MTKSDYGKPLFENLRYCIRCCIPETVEGVMFDEIGVCQACQSSEQKIHINWVEREKKLREIIENAKSKAGNNYDCIIPISGGKDSTFQLHVLVKVYKLKPLAVTFSHNWFSETGWYNLQNALHVFNVDHIMFTPNRDLVNRIAKRSLSGIGDSCWHCHAGVGAFPIQAAVKFNIPLLIWGESIAESSGRASYFNPVIKMSTDYITKVSVKLKPDEMKCDYLTERDLYPFNFPSAEEIEKASITGIHLGDYIFWDDERQTEFVRDNYFWKETEIENAYKGYKSAECIMPGMHDFTCYLKRGWGRATFHASLDVRNGILTREEGFQLISSIDTQRPEVLDYYLKITGLKESEFFETIEKQIAPALRNKIIPITPKKGKNKERLIPFAEQLIEKHRTIDNSNFHLKELCFTCGLELVTGTPECKNCSNADTHKHILVTELKDYFKKVVKSSGNNYDCIIPVDESWQSAYLLHLLTKIYNIKPLAITFNKYLGSEIGWYNIINCIESFHVDQLMLTLNPELAEKFQSESSKLNKDVEYFSEIGLYSFMVKTACKFNIPTIIGFHSVVNKIAQKVKKTIVSKIAFLKLQNVINEITHSGINQRDIHLFSPEYFDKQSVEKLSLINASDFFPFNNTAHYFVEKNYGWKEEETKNPIPFFETFFKKNKPNTLPPYILTNQQKKTKKRLEYDSDITRLSATTILQGYINKDFSPVDLAKQTIKKIEKLESKINAWEAFDAEKYLNYAKLSEEKIQKESVTLILEGIPVGVKDVFNTLDFPTQMGSALWNKFSPGNDARAVFNIKRAGGIICGKTVTSEFAVHALNKTINPHAPDRTPGTSSSGSAAAVATGMIPITLATQSGSSIIRPASFCGIYGFKPSFGLIPRTGILKTADTLDNVGFFVNHAEDLSNVFDAIRLHGTNYPMNYHGMNRSISRINNKDAKWKIAFVKTHTWGFTEEYAKKSMLSCVDKISRISGFEVMEVDLPSRMETCHDLHSVIYDYCLAYYFKEEFNKKNNLSDWLLEQIEHGKNISHLEYQNALKEQVCLWQAMDDFLKNYDVMVSLSTAGIAPIRGEREKPDTGLMWTLTNLPSLNVPIFKSLNGIPFGLQIASKRYADLLILNFLKLLIEKDCAPLKSYPDISKIF